MFRQPALGLITRRAFATSPIARTNIGKLPIKLNDSVQCFVEEIPYEFSKTFSKGKETYRLDRQIIIKGPKGVLKTAVPKFVQISNVDNTITVSVDEPENKIQRSMWGTTRALLQNNFIGASEGHLAIVKFVGTGYRATIEEAPNGKKVVALKIGYPYTPKLPVPEGLTISSPSPTRLLIEGADKQQVKLFAAVIRKYKKPEPYKGKGIFVDDETIKLKEKKIK
ncbi:ribosomal protein L6 [Suhomyces tanzawaensis NRRL Y-17324]|uniref:Ribosomal protein L6 n=1 Tax=Suhomyces tanzawaensis NRRL Y-17324 TaxID=984487 RepID=A0A1E4SFA6_9ASCO|nr:ribosomal protein L6 [Suhomyces tanzawaensis NRRL Y-17324]ODV78163.1 ribosomal protein L6 [Suhomyces tanzawaensis NRRL Y-17324]